MPISLAQELLVYTYTQIVPKERQSYWGQGAVLPKHTLDFRAPDTAFEGGYFWIAFRLRMSCKDEALAEALESLLAEGLLSNGKGYYAPLKSKRASKMQPAEPIASSENQANKQVALEAIWITPDGRKRVEENIPKRRSIGVLLMVFALLAVGGFFFWLLLNL